MPRNRKYGQNWEEQVVLDRNSANHINLGSTGNKLAIHCKVCKQLLSHKNPKPGQYCHICRRRARPRWRKGPLPVHKFYSETNEMNANILHSDNVQIYNNAFNEEITSRVNNFTWDRRVYPTPIGISPDFYANNNNYQPFLDRRVRLKPNVEFQNTDYYHRRVNYHENSSSSSHTYSTGKNKRKLEIDYIPNKKQKNEISSRFPSFSELSKNIWDHFEENCQTDDNFESKMSLRSKLQKIIETKFTGSDLFVFGSSMTGFASKTSDIDMCLMFHGLEIPKNKVIGILWQLRSLLSKQNHLRSFQVIRAKVPILKFKDVMSGFDIDLNINNPTGIRNSQLLRSYARLDERVRPLILALKFWARYHSINDAKSGTLSSYSLGLMFIHYLQYRCFPPVLPSLQVLQQDKFLVDADVRTLKIDEDLPPFRSENTQNLGQLFVGFLNYYANEYDFKNSRISVRLGQILPRDDKMLSKQKDLKYWIDIEEPFERTNTARSVHRPETAYLIKSVFDKSYNLVIEQGTIGNV